MNSQVGFYASMISMDLLPQAKMLMMAGRATGAGNVTMTIRTNPAGVEMVRQLIVLIESRHVMEVNLQ